MSEHTYRLLVGTTMLVLLYTGNHLLAYAIIAMATFEGLTNLRLNLMVTKIRRRLGHNIPVKDPAVRKKSRINFDSERAQRLFIAAAFTVTFFVLPKDYWIVNWFFAFGMLISGIVLYCPLIAFFRAVGFR